MIIFRYLESVTPILIIHLNPLSYPQRVLIMEGYSIEMSKSGMHLVNSEDPINDSSIDSDFSDQKSYNHSDSYPVQKHQ